VSVLTKVFIVLQLVFSLALAVLVIFTLGSIQNYRKQVESSQVAQIAAAANAVQLQNELTLLQSKADAAMSQAKADAANDQNTIAGLKTDMAKLQRESDVVSSEAATDKANLTAAVLSVSGLTDQIKARDTELSSARPQVLKLTAENADLNRTNASLQTQLDSADKAIRTLQEEIAKSSTSTAPAGTQANAGTQMEGQTATLAAAAPVNGKVTDVQAHDGRTFITLSLGERDKVEPNTRFTVFRGDTYVGDAVVTKATIDQSVAVVTITKPGEAVKTDDMVISGAGF
jgi:hypothetical protein